MQGNRLSIVAGVFAAAVFVTTPFATTPFGSDVRAQQPTYSQWQQPERDGKSRRMQDLVDKLNKLIDKAERDRAADPAFLRDLRGLTHGVDRPWRVRLFGDEFQDGNFTDNPVWTVSSGKYWVERGWGLRSSVDAAASVQSGAEQPQQRRTPEEKAAAIFGQILGQVLNKGSDSGTSTSSKTAAVASDAVIHSAARISNIFLLETDFSSWSKSGRMQVAVYQGDFNGAATAGYRLAYTPGGQIEILRISRRGTHVIESAALSTPLEDRKIHRLTWERHRDGRMTVAVDGQAVLEGRDHGFRDPFNGVALINSGGDYIVKRLSVTGTP